MKAERDQFLPESVNNKGNGFRKVNGLGISESLALRIPRDRLSQFKPLILEIMRESNDQLEELCFELYYKGLTTREIEDVTENIYGKHYLSQKYRILTRLSIRIWSCLENAKLIAIIQ